MHGSATFNYFQIFHKERTDQPCLCLCLGFSQMILMEPFLLMTLHFSQIGFTDALTFILTSISTFSQNPGAGKNPDQNALLDALRPTSFQKDRYLL